MVKKLGIKTGHEVLVVGAPARYVGLLEPLPDDVRFTSNLSKSTDIIHIFTARREELENALSKFRASMKPTTVVWVSWPKKTSKVPTDITEDMVRELALPMGLVDVKVCAVDDIWSGLKLVVRKELR